jgi:prenyltransferase beta subunit
MALHAHHALAHITAADDEQTLAFEARRQSAKGGLIGRQNTPCKSSRIPKDEFQHHGPT